jgi:hypothetical protein
LKVRIELKVMLVEISLLATLGCLLTPQAFADDCEPDQGMTFLCGPQNAEDLVFLPETPWMIASGMSSEGVNGHLYLVNPDTHTFQELYPESGKDAFDKQAYPDCLGPLDRTNFSAHGLSLLTIADGRHQLYVTSHGAREAVEVFAVDAQSAQIELSWVGCVPIPTHNDINSVAALADGGFLTTRIAGQGPLASGDIFAGEVTGFLYEWHPGGSLQSVPGTQMSGPNGIVVSADQRSVYVALWGGQGVTKFERGAENILTPVQTLELPFRPDNLRWTSSGSILAVGHRMSANSDCGQPLCFDAWEVAEVDPKTMTAEIVLTKKPIPGFTGATVALRHANGLWLGTFHGDRLVQVEF